MPRAKKFSILRFSLLVSALFTMLLLGIRFLLPDVWATQTRGGWKPVLCVFLAMHLFNAFFEWFYHRYILHQMPVGLVKRMATSHRLHHSLTQIRLEAPLVGADRFILNHYPITEVYQYESSAFPWWALLGFWAFFTPFLVGVQLGLPRLPVILGGYMAVTWSMLCYEILHAIEHLPYEWWKQHVEHPLLGTMWKKFYGFHHMHHANVRCNEAIGGFFGLPVADWVFGTYFQPEDLLLHGRLATAKQFAIPRPPRLVRWFDRFVRQQETSHRHGTR